MVSYTLLHIAVLWVTSSINLALFIHVPLQPGIRLFLTIRGIKSVLVLRFESIWAFNAHHEIEKYLFYMYNCNLKKKKSC